MISMSDYHQVLRDAGGSYEGARGAARGIRVSRIGNPVRAAIPPGQGLTS